jgi:hypothetical protein
MSDLGEIKEAINAILNKEGKNSDGKDSAVELDIPFAYDPVIVTQLGSTIYKNLTEAHIIFTTQDNHRKGPF